MSQSLADRLAALDARIRELEDAREIENTFQYWHHVTTGGFAGSQAGKMEALDVLTEDGTIEIQVLHKPGEGPKGREAYTKYWDFYYGDKGPLPYVFQTGVDKGPIIEGDRAVEDSVQLILLQARGGPVTYGMSGRRNWLRREPEGWKIEKTTGPSGLNTHFAELRGPLNDSSLPEA